VTDRTEIHTDGTFNDQTRVGGRHRCGKDVEFAWAKRDQ